MPKTVSIVRSFWLRMSLTICRSASLKLSMSLIQSAADKSRTA
jgi:hypothetical protein